MSSPVALEPPPVELAPHGVEWDELPDAPAPPAAPSRGPAAKLALGLAALIVLVALIAKGGSTLGPMTLVEIALTFVGASVAGYAILAAPTPRHAWGSGALLALAALTVWTGLSVIWSVAPDGSWVDANRAIAYLFAFAGAIGLARLWPTRAGAILAGALAAATAISVIALVLKCFPVAFNSTQELARLRDPLDYWNALGLLAAFAIPPALWLGSQRDGPPALRALAWPLFGLAVVVVMLSYSRGVLIALVVGVAFWFAFVPLRLRGLAVLIGGTAGGAAVTVWAFAQDALSKDRAPLPDRVDSGETLALLCVAMVLVQFAVGLAVNRRADRDPLSERWRERVGLGALGIGVGALIALAIGLSVTGGGPTARAGRAWDNFFSTNKASTTYGPSRLKSIGTRRGSYWREAYDVWKADKVVGAGANGYLVARKRYRKDPIEVAHAHGYVPQTAADLGLVGLGISLLALIAWIVAAARTCGSRRRFSVRQLDPRLLPAWGRRQGERLGRVPAAAARIPTAFVDRADRAAPRRPVDGDRVALLTLVTIVITFGVHSLIDWTWFVPATALVALVAAGYVAGRGPWGVPGPERTRPIANRLVSAAALGVVGLAAAWAIWQPLRADKASDAALAALDAGSPNDARVEAREAHDRNPLALRPLFDLSTIEDAAGRKAEAQKALEEAVRLQPSNPAAWSQLATYQLNTLQQPVPAFQSARAALFLDPKSVAAQALFLDAYRRLPRRPAKRGGSKKPNAGQVLGALSKLGSGSGAGTAPKSSGQGEGTK